MALPVKETGSLLRLAVAVFRLLTRRIFPEHRSTGQHVLSPGRSVTEGARRRPAGIFGVVPVVANQASPTTTSRLARRPGKAGERTLFRRWCRRRPNAAPRPARARRALARRADRIVTRARRIGLVRRPPPPYAGCTAAEPPRRRAAPIALRTAHISRWNLW